jgi:hypothetical protein
MRQFEEEFEQGEAMPDNRNVHINFDFGRFYPPDCPFIRKCPAVQA